MAQLSCPPMSPPATPEPCHRILRPGGDLHRGGSLHPARLRRVRGGSSGLTGRSAGVGVLRSDRSGLRAHRELHRGHGQRHGGQPGLRGRPADPARGRPGRPHAPDGRPRHRTGLGPAGAVVPSRLGPMPAISGREPARGGDRAHQLDGRGRPAASGRSCVPTAPPWLRAWPPSSTAWRSWPRPWRTTRTTRPASWPWHAQGCRPRPDMTRPASCASSARTIPGACTPS